MASYNKYPHPDIYMLSKLKEDTIHLLPKDDLVEILLEVKKSTEDAVVSIGRKILNKLTGEKPPQIEKQYLSSWLKYIPGEESAKLGMKEKKASIRSDDKNVELISKEIDFLKSLAD